MVEVTAFQGGVIGLRKFEEGSGCPLDLSTVTLDGKPAVLELEGSVQADRLHPTTLRQHVFVAVKGKGASSTTRKATTHMVRARFSAACGAALASAAPALSSRNAVGIPTIPPFAKPSYPATSSIVRHASGDWVGQRGKAGYKGFDIILDRFSRTHSPAVCHFSRGVRRATLSAHAGGVLTGACDPTL